MSNEQKVSKTPKAPKVKFFYGVKAEFKKIIWPDKGYPVKTVRCCRICFYCYGHYYFAHRCMNAVRCQFLGQCEVRRFLWQKQNGM